MAGKSKGLPIPSALVEFILLGPLDDRRQLQDSPILGDVWVEFGKNPGEALDLLIAPYRGQHAGSVAAAIDDALGHNDDLANIAYLQGLVVARLTFEEVLRAVVPNTKWWLDKWDKDDSPATQKKKGKRKGGEQKAGATSAHKLGQYTADKLKSVLDSILGSAKDWHSQSGTRRLQELPALDRFVALTGLILWAGTTPAPETLPTKPDDQISYILDHANVEEISKLLADLAKKMLKDSARDPRVWQVSLNRRAMPALTKSIPAVKADAAKTLFKVNCSEIAWAVIDSGIDGDHPAFRNGIGKSSRVKRSFDFKNFRKIVSLSNSKDAIRKVNVAALMKDEKLLVRPPSDPDGDLKRLADDARSRGPIHWDLVEKFVEIKPDTPPPTNHGTHVAGDHRRQQGRCDEGRG